MNDNIKRKLAENLGAYCFSNIWNEPQKEYRVNVRAHLLRSLSVTGGFTLRDGTYQTLPTSMDSYFVYTLYRTNIHGLTINSSIPGTWVDTTTLCNIYKVLMHVYTKDGRIVSKQNAYINWKCDGSLIYLAVKKSTLLKLTSVSNVDELYVTLYRDSNVANDIKIRSYHINASDDTKSERYAFWTSYTDEILRTTTKFNVFMDGYEVRLGSVEDIPQGCDIDILLDDNISFQFEVDLMSPSQDNMTYLSSKDNIYKRLLHIPKAYNPSNRVITDGTVELYVRDKDSIRGVYFMRTASDAISSITHNDFGIAVYNLEACMDYLNTQHIILKVVVRYHDNDNHLVRTKDYVDLLYANHDDADIVKHLLNRHSYPITFWTAKHLENSTYVKMLNDIPDDATSDHVPEYIDALGYYHTVSLMCSRITYIKVDGFFTGEVRVPKPYLYADEEVFVVVYKNGYKIPWDMITNISNVCGDHVCFNITDEANCRLGDTLAVELFIDGVSNSYSVIPTEEQLIFTVPCTKFNIIEELTIDATAGYNRTDTKSYVKRSISNDLIGEVTVTKDEATGKTTLKFSTTLIGRKFIIQGIDTTYRFSKSIKSDMLNGKVLTLDLEWPIFESTDGSKCPIMKYKNTQENFMEVYLNSRKLVADIDYSIFQHVDNVGNTICPQIVIQNMEFLRDPLTTDNVVEVIIAAPFIENETYGFVIDDRADTSKDDVTLYFKEISSCHVYGLMEPDITYKGAYFTLPAGKYKNGVPFHVRTSIPIPVKEFMDEYTNHDTDVANLTVLNDYFYLKMDDRPPMIVQGVTSYRVYSSHMAHLINMIVDGKLPASIDPDPTKMTENLTAYKKYLDSDLIHKARFNTHTMDALPHYRDYSVTDLTLRSYVNQLIRVILAPEDPITSGVNDS